MHVNLRELPGLAESGLDRALQHARACDRCRIPVERAMLATRFLEQGTPWEPTAAELEAIGRRGPPRIRAASPSRLRWPVLASIGVAATAVAVLIWIRPAEFTERGTGEGRAVLRMFCATRAPGGLHEVPPAGRCTGDALAFAAGARGDLTSVALELRDADGTRLLGSFTVTGRPGGEAPLEVTPELHGAGPIEVTAAFASSPEAALASLQGTAAPGVVIVRQAAIIDPGP